MYVNSTQKIKISPPEKINRNEVCIYKKEGKKKKNMPRPFFIIIFTSSFPRLVAFLIQTYQYCQASVHVGVP